MIAKETGLDKNGIHRILTVQRVQTDIADDWVLHHDNAPAHTALLVQEFLMKKNIATLPKPPYSPDLAP
jgi:transposase